MRNRGTIVNVGSALAYRSVPLQSVYCGAKAAISGFTDSLRSEIIHDKLDVHLTMVDLPAVNTPQFDWALNKMGRKAKPVAPIFEFLVRLTRRGSCRLSVKPVARTPRS
ncbi:SDR family NAD(P)-dependent oxidoreductase [Mesorhizobium sp. ESP7-2]|uniref:SDR family NAD(P)-dependent oxidoreductase n=1 Tax=Mesorhizobium sp. ESP7-2 TaxID=2876622 RepID=UPI001AEE3151|nr:SDR family NAD(P)-dependent oxidoreductase [Mesorhizobium sp. ESP7-2]